MLRFFAISLLATVTVGCNKAPKFKTYERPAFAVELPDWEVAMEDGTPGNGKYKVERKGHGFAEISWQGSAEATSPDELRLYTDALTGAWKVTVDGKPQATEGKLDHRLTVLGSIMDGKVWLKMTLIACRKTNVFLTLAAGAQDRADAVRNHDHSARTLRCLGDSPERFKPPGAPASTLQEVGFTRSKDGDGFLFGHPDGTTIVASATGSSTVRALKEHPDKTLQSIAIPLQWPLRLVSPTVFSIRGLGVGTTMWAVQARDTSTKQPVVLGIFECAAGVAYMVLATGPLGVEFDALDSHLKRLGCPRTQ